MELLDAFIHKLRQEPALAQWAASFATFLAVVVALLPTWLNRRERRTQAIHLSNQIATTVFELKCYLKKMLDTRSGAVGDYTINFEEQRADKAIGSIRLLFSQAHVLPEKEYFLFLCLLAELPHLSTRFKDATASADSKKMFAEFLMPFLEKYLEAANHKVPVKEASLFIDGLP